VSSTQATRFATVEEALEDIASGRMVVVVDDEDRENEGDLVIAAEHVTADVINFMATHARGWICLALTPERCDALGLELMTAKNETPHQTPFTVTIEAREGVTTGISAADRAHTIRVAVDPAKGADDIVKGGHVNPLKAKPGGVLERTGHTEASVDLARLAGLTPAGVICEIMNEDGSMARVGDLQAYCFKHGLRLITIADLIAYRRRHDKLVERVVTTRLPTAFGEFEAVGYSSLVDDKHHVALVKGEVSGKEDVLVRVHSECLTGDVFHSLRCDCGEQLEFALAQIERAGRGVLLYLAQEGRGIGLLNKLRAYKLQEEGLDTVDANLRLGLPADLRDYGIGAQILVDLGLTSIRILTNNPKKIRGLEGYGLSVTEQVPIAQIPNPHNEAYLRAKAERLGHTLHHQGLNLDEEMLHSERERRAHGADEDVGAGSGDERPGA
jgi:3,4-dihydroxy 2-butanone 4-phosphate synthase/GTP cyclohydrolase II